MCNLDRVVIKMSGESGMGTESSGGILSKAIKNQGYYVVTEREFPSLIKAPKKNNNYFINFAPNQIRGVSNIVDIDIALGKTGLLDALNSVRKGGVILHTFDRWKQGVPDAESRAESNGQKLIEVPAIKIAKDNGGGPLFSNTVTLGAVWAMLGLSIDDLMIELKAKFGKKKALWDTNQACLKDGYSFIKNILDKDGFVFNTPEAINDDTKNHMIIGGNTALGLGAVHAGMRAFYAYPMSPATSMLVYLATIAEEMGVVVKQVEDEITAAQMALGSMHMGTRSMTATSGGGFDLMTETVSLSGIIETPLVIMVAQRPGPGTGMPTWTAQADLDLAIYSGHGEYAKMVVAVSDPESCFELIQQAFNYAEEYQIPVILLTEKHIADSTVTVPQFVQNTVEIKRGLVTDDEQMVSKDRYKLTKSGVSPRWLPGSRKEIYFANGDEHHEDGTLNETETAAKMINKRNIKLDTMRAALPDAIVYGDPAESDISIIGWGSTKGAVLDAADELIKEGIKVSYLDIQYLWPLRTETLNDYINKSNKVYVVEGNRNGQLTNLIKKETDHKLEGFYKYNGRVFKVEEIIKFVKKKI